MTRQIIATGIMFAAFMDSASAHPGHGSVSHPSGLVHYLTSPMHMGVIALCIIAGTAVWQIAKTIEGKSESEK